MSHNTLVTYTDKNSKPMLTRSDLQISNSKPLDKLWPVLSLVTPDNPGSKSCHAPIGKL